MGTPLSGGQGAAATRTRRCRSRIQSEARDAPPAELAAPVSRRTLQPSKCLRPCASGGGRRRDISEAERQRRPSWGPPLIIKGELLDACRELGYLAADDKPIVRLWAQFADPKKRVRSCANSTAVTRSPASSAEDSDYMPGASAAWSVRCCSRHNVKNPASWRFGPDVYVSNDGPRSPRYREWERLVRTHESTSDPAEIKS